MTSLTLLGSYASSHTIGKWIKNMTKPLHS